MKKEMIMNKPTLDEYMMMAKHLLRKMIEENAFFVGTEREVGELRLEDKERLIGWKISPPLWIVECRLDCVFPIISDISTDITVDKDDNVFLAPKIALIQRDDLKRVLRLFSTEFFGGVLSSWRHIFFRGLQKGDFTLDELERAFVTLVDDIIWSLQLNDVNGYWGEKVVCDKELLDELLWVPREKKDWLDLLNKHYEGYGDIVKRLGEREWLKNCEEMADREWLVEKVEA